MCLVIDKFTEHEQALIRCAHHEIVGRDIEMKLRDIELKLHVIVNEQSTFSNANCSYSSGKPPTSYLNEFMDIYINYQCDVKETDWDFLKSFPNL